MANRPYRTKCWILILNWYKNSQISTQDALLPDYFQQIPERLQSLPEAAFDNEESKSHLIVAGGTDLYGVAPIPLLLQKTSNYFIAKELLKKLLRALSRFYKEISLFCQSRSGKMRKKA